MESFHKTHTKSNEKEKLNFWWKVRWDSHVSSHLNRVLEFEFKKNKKIQVPKTHVSFSRIFSSESSLKNKVKKYKFLKHEWDSQVPSHLNRVQNSTKVKKYEFLKLTGVSHTYPHVNQV